VYKPAGTQTAMYTDRDHGRVVVYTTMYTAVYGPCTLSNN